jgi:hypothetical protein
MVEWWKVESNCGNLKRFNHDPMPNPAVIPTKEGSAGSSYNYKQHIASN